MKKIRPSTRRTEEKEQLWPGKSLRSYKVEEYQQKTNNNFSKNRGEMKYSVNPSMNQTNLLFDNANKYLEIEKPITVGFPKSKEQLKFYSRLPSPQKELRRESSLGPKYPIFEKDGQKISNVLQITPSPLTKNIRRVSIVDDLDIAEEGSPSLNNTSIKKFEVHKYESRTTSGYKRNPNTKLSNSMNNYKLNSVRNLKSKYFNSEKGKKIKKIEIEDRNRPKRDLHSERSSSKIGPKAHIEYLERSNSRMKGKERFKTERFESNSSLKSYQKYREKFSSLVKKENKSLAYPNPGGNMMKNLNLIQYSRYQRLLRNGKEMLQTNHLNSQPPGDTSPVVSPQITPIKRRRTGFECDVNVSEFSAQIPKRHTTDLFFHKHNKFGKLN